jgi:Ca2+-binding RTX toxin-like protein
MSGLIVALVVVGALAGGSGAFAGSGGLANATTLDLAAGPGENNAVTLAVSGTRLLLTDSAVVPTLSPTAAGLGCVLAGNTISCPKAGVTTVTIETGDGSDQVTIDPTLGTASSVGAIVVDGGSGDDSITNDSTVATTASYADSAAGVTVDLGSGSATGDGNDTLTGVTNVIGSSLGDSLSGDANANVLAGGGGSDLLAGRGGADTLDGGGGTDTVDYSAAAAGVVVDLAAGVASADGDGGSDTLVSVENVTGSSLGDSLSGDANANVLAGGGGADNLVGGLGADTIDGWPGDDTISARDGIIDTITCGGGTDSVTADRNDVTAADCEQVQVPPPVVLIGETTLQRGIDQNVAGLAEAFSFVAAQTGTATEIQFYDDASSTASKVVVGLYADNGSGSPGSLLAQATRTALAGGAWNTVQISGAGLTAHVRYWLALLTPAGSGTLRFRDNCCGFKGPAPSQNSAQSNLSQLPATWAKGKVWPTDGPASLFAAR